MTIVPTKSCRAHDLTLCLLLNLSHLQTLSQTTSTVLIKDCDQKLRSKLYPTTLRRLLNLYACTRIIHWCKALDLERVEIRSTKSFVCWMFGHERNQGKLPLIIGSSSIHTRLDQSLIHETYIQAKYPCTLFIATAAFKLTVFQIIGSLWTWNVQLVLGNKYWCKLISLHTPYMQT